MLKLNQLIALFVTTFQHFVGESNLDDGILALRMTADLYERYKTCPLNSTKEQVITHASKAFDDVALKYNRPDLIVKPACRSGETITTKYQ